MEDYKKEFEEVFIKPFNELMKKGEEIIAKYKSKEQENGKMPKGEIWKPAKDEEYWSVGIDGFVFLGVNSGTQVDKDCILFGNAYSTQEKAEFEANREKYTRLFRQYVEQHSEPLDWEDDYQEKWYVYLSGDKKDICFDYNTLCPDAFQIYASSKEVLQEAIEFVGESNFKKYALEVED